MLLLQKCLRYYKGSSPKWQAGKAGAPNRAPKSTKKADFRGRSAVHALWLDASVLRKSLGCGICLTSQRGFRR